MGLTYSIAEARNQFTGVIREAAVAAEGIAITRRGKTVAVILSVDAYEALVARQARPDFWSAFQAYQALWPADEDAAGDEPWADVREADGEAGANPWD